MLPSEKTSVTTKWGSLFSLMDVTCTGFGSRLLHYRLSNPMLDVEKIHKSHNDVEMLI